MSKGAAASTRAYVAAGSNVEPLRNLRDALDELARNHPTLRVSPAYRNPAAGFEGDDFVNLVLELDAPGTVRDLLRELHAIEERGGRPRLAPKWAPRAMDLDVLLFGDTVIDEPDLKLPRPDLVRRAYMLKPMVDLAPDLRHPTLGATMAELWRGFDAVAHPLTSVDLGWRRRHG
jgi:2-amino-4-hydroxy-6-hydroxymethyldihydropteridine diphosphokinase